MLLRQELLSVSRQMLFLDRSHLFLVVACCYAHDHECVTVRVGSLTETEPVNMDLEEIEVLHPCVLPLFQTGPYITKKIVTSSETQPIFEEGQISLPFLAIFREFLVAELYGFGSRSH